MTLIVDAGPGDGAAVAHIHASSWKATYRGILPDSYLDHEVDNERAVYWQAALQNRRYAIVKMARVSEKLVGLIAMRDDATDEGYDFTIEHLHLLPAHRGKGLGRDLLRAGAEAARGEGASSLCLWVFEDNVAAIAFYERLGGVTDAHGVDKFAGSDAPDRRIGWRDLDMLIARCQDR